MLKRLTIQNYALIDHILFEPGMNLNVITGETGAGKSILLGALGLILGDRTDSSVNSIHGKKTIVEAEFIIHEKHKEFFKNRELDFDKNCIVRREINDQGKSRAFINDTPVTIQNLRELSSLLVDMHSQHETLDLNARSFQYQVIDTLGESVDQALHVKKLYLQLKEAGDELEKLKKNAQEAARENDYLQFLFQEFKEVNPIEGEEEELEIEIKKLEHADEIIRLTRQAFQLLEENDDSAISIIKASRNAISQAHKNHPALNPILQRIESVHAEIADIAADLEKESENIQTDPESLERIQNRLNSLYQLQTKHRVKSNSELLELQLQIENKLNAFQSIDDSIIQIQTRITELQEKLIKEAKQLTTRRAQAAQILENDIKKLLKEVGLEKSNLQVALNTKDDVGIEGFEDIQFLFTANKGSAPVPIQKTASGGELSRIMLCIKSIIAGKMDLPTLIFDEIDTGISGETAVSVGELMKKLSTLHQIISITHLPQIAGKAAQHYKVYKEEKHEKTYTKLQLLNKQEHVEEVARMLGGKNISDAILKTAHELTGN